MPNKRALSEQAAGFIETMDCLRSAGTSALRQAMLNDPEKTHNSQMDIVLALWKKDLIVRNSQSQEGS
jgi:hypothetical protein